MLKTLREIQDYFHESAALAYRRADKLNRGSSSTGSCCLYAEHQAFSHAAAHVNEYIKQHEADLLKG